MRFESCVRDPVWRFTAFTYIRLWCLSPWSPLKVYGTHCTFNWIQLTGRTFRISIFHSNNRSISKYQCQQILKLIHLISMLYDILVWSSFFVRKRFKIPSLFQYRYEWYSIWNNSLLWTILEFQRYLDNNTTLFPPISSHGRFSFARIPRDELYIMFDISIIDTSIFPIRYIIQSLLTSVIVQPYTTFETTLSWIRRAAEKRLRWTNNIPPCMPVALPSRFDHHNQFNT